MIIRSCLLSLIGLFLLITALKLTGYIDWSWWIVFIPLSFLSLIFSLQYFINPEKEKFLSRREEEDSPNRIKSIVKPDRFNITLQELRKMVIFAETYGMGKWLTITVERRSDGLGSTFHVFGKDDENDIIYDIESL